MILLQGLSLLGKEEFGKSIPVGSSNAVETYLQKMSSFEWAKETTQEFANAMQYVNSVCDYKKSELDAKIAEIRVDLRPTRDGWDILADLGRPAFVASQNQAEDNRIKMHNQQVQSKIDAVQEKVNIIVKFQNETIKKMTLLTEAKNKEAAMKRFNEYWTTHADDRAALEDERKTLCDEKKQLDSQIKAFEVGKNYVPAIKDFENVQGRIFSLTMQKNNLGLFKGKEKRTIQTQIDALEKEAAEAKKLVDTQQADVEKQIEPLRSRLNETENRIKGIDTEFDKDR